MKIMIQSEDMSINLPIPLGIIDSLLVRIALKEGLKKSKTEIDINLMMEFLHIVKKELKHYKGLHLVQVETEDTYIDIIV